MRRPILYALRWSFCHVRHDESGPLPKVFVVPENLTALSDQVSDDEWGGAVCCDSIRGSDGPFGDFI